MAVADIRPIRSGLALAAWLLAVQAATAVPVHAQVARGPLVFAAASLKTALDAIVSDWQRASGVRARISYAGSATVVRQLEQGAPADIVITADREWMDHAQRRGLIAPASRQDLVGNRLVLVAPASSSITIRLGEAGSLGRVIGDGRLAVGQVQTVPAGKYARQALLHFGQWSGVAGRLAQADNVRAALALVARAEASLGIVYGTDARAEPRVRVVATFPADSHQPIVYPYALVEGRRSDPARALFRHLGSAKARAVFEAEGFAMIAPAGGGDR